MKNINITFWEESYKYNKIGWDVGYATQPITDYIDKIENKEIKILIPGAGNGYEAEYVYNKSFKNTFLLDFANFPLINFRQRVPNFPEENIINEDFFIHKGKYDLIIEQTFFCSLHRKDREKYVNKIYDLLVTKGRVVGLLFNHEFESEMPPYGGLKEEYFKLFSKYFTIKKLEISYNSIKPRQGRELFFIFEKR